MRYLAGFSGGLVVAILLFAFQDYLISGERIVDPGPGVHVFLPVVKTSRPAEIKPYEPQDPPPKPERIEKPAAISEPASVAPVRPTLLATSDIGVPVAHGTGPYVEWGGGGGRMDGGPAVKIPVAPQYPPAALRGGIEGEVELEFTIRADGSVADIRVVRADPPGMFEQSARRAMMRWEFLPKVENGQAVEMRARQVIEFRLPD